MSPTPRKTGSNAGKPASTAGRPVVPGAQPRASVEPGIGGPGRSSPTAVAPGSPETPESDLVFTVGSARSSVRGQSASTQPPLPGQPRPSSRPGPRRVRLQVSRIDPWSAMKVGFLVSVAFGLAGIMLTTVLWGLLMAMGVFSALNNLITQVMGDASANSTFNLLDFIGFGRSVSLAIVLGVVNVVIMTALSALGAFLYNVCASLVGGLQVTLTDD